MSNTDSGATHPWPLWEHDFQYFLFSRWAITFRRFAKVTIGIEWR